MFFNSFFTCKIIRDLDHQEVLEMLLRDNLIILKIEVDTFSDGIMTYLHLLLLILFL